MMPWLLAILLSVHIYQISKAITSNEMANAHRLEYFYPSVKEVAEYEKKHAAHGTRPESILPQSLSIFKPGISDLDDPEWYRGWPLSQRPYSNPFDAGILGNWKDFFCHSKGVHSHISYDKLYERPLHCLPNGPGTVYLKKKKCCSNKKSCDQDREELQGILPGDSSGQQARPRMQGWLVSLFQKVLVFPSKQYDPVSGNEEQEP
jgi:hypothetical protein